MLFYELLCKFPLKKKKKNLKRKLKNKYIVGKFSLFLSLFQKLFVFVSLVEIACDLGEEFCRIWVKLLFYLAWRFVDCAGGFPFLRGLP